LLSVVSVLAISEDKDCCFALKWHGLMGWNLIEEFTVSNNLCGESYTMSVL